MDKDKDVSHGIWLKSKDYKHEILSADIKYQYVQR